MILHPLFLLVFLNLNKVEAVETPLSEFHALARVTPTVVSISAVFWWSQEQRLFKWQIQCKLVVRTTFLKTPLVLGKGQNIAFPKRDFDNPERVSCHIGVQ